MLGEDSPKCKASAEVTTQISNRETAKHLGENLKKEGSWRDAPISNNDLWSAISSGPRRIKPLQPLPQQGQAVYYNNCQSQRGRPYNNRGYRGQNNQNFGRGRGSSRPSSTQARPNHAPTVNITDENMTEEEQRMLTAYRQMQKK